MKSFKKVFRSLLMVALVVGVFMATGIVGSAAADKYPAKIRMWPQGTSSIDISFANPGSYIKIVKTSSKNLLAKYTSHDEVISNDSGNSEYDNRDSIGLYAKKAGNYKVYFDIYTKAGKKVGKTRTVTVYVKTDSPIKSATFRGKRDFYGIQTVSSGAFKVQMNSGYKLKKIEYGVNKLKKDGNRTYTEQEWKTIKNGGTVKLNAKPNYYENKYEYVNEYNPEFSRSSWNWTDEIIARTEIKVTYIDKWTKQEAVDYFGLSKLALNKTK